MGWGRGVIMRMSFPKPLFKCPNFIQDNINQIHSRSQNMRATGKKEMRDSLFTVKKINR